MTLLLFLLGIALLIAGSEALVRGASQLALTIGLSPLVVGLTVVALGTSAPEVAVTLQSAVNGQADVALGNVVGSNITNILLILGLAAVVAPLVVADQLLRLDVPLMVGVSFLPLLLGLDGRIGRLDGVLLLAGAIGYIVLTAVQSRRASARMRLEFAVELGLPPPFSLRRLVTNLALVAGGLALLILGAGWIVDAAVAFATAAGVSTLIVGLTIVAVGTSLPEIAASMVASVRGERDIALGNVIGSNLFNILLVLGAGSVLAPQGLAVAPQALSFDIPIMIAVAVASLPVVAHGYTIYRWEGALFLVYYVAYVSYLVLNATRSPLLPVFTMVMLAFVFPITLVTLVILAVRIWHARRLQRAGGG